MGRRELRVVPRAVRLRQSRRLPRVIKPIVGGISIFDARERVIRLRGIGCGRGVGGDQGHGRSGCGARRGRGAGRAWVRVGLSRGGGSFGITVSGSPVSGSSGRILKLHRREKVGDRIFESGVAVNAVGRVSLARPIYPVEPET